MGGVRAVNPTPPHVLAPTSTSPSTHLQRHGETVRAIRAACQQRPGCFVAIMLDTKGPEIRTGLLVDHKAVTLKEGQVSARLRVRVRRGLLAAVVHRGALYTRGSPRLRGASHVSRRVSEVPHTPSPLPSQDLEITTDYEILGDATRISCSY